MRIYIATKFENAPRAIEVATQLEAVGHVITYKWWTNDTFSREQARKDMKGVRDADALVFIAETDVRYSGALTEFGMALAWGIPIHLLGNAIDNNIFTSLDNVYRGIDRLLNSPTTYSFKAYTTEY